MDCFVHKYFKPGDITSGSRYFYLSPYLKNPLNIDLWNRAERRGPCIRLNRDPGRCVILDCPLDGTNLEDEMDNKL